MSDNQASEWADAQDKLNISPQQKVAIELISLEKEREFMSGGG